MNQHTKDRYNASGANPYERIIKLIGKNYKQFVENLLVVFPSKGKKIAQAISNKRQDSLYHTFPVYKKRGKKGVTKKARKVYSPCIELKLIQKDLDAIVRTQYTPNQCSHGFEPSKSTRTAAEQLRAVANLAEKETTNVDIKGAFPAIQGKAVRSLLRHKTNASFELNNWQINVVAKLLTSSDDRLATGSPASPAVFNWRLTSLDNEMERFCKGKGWNYIRYADDLTITHYKTQKKEVIEAVIGFLKLYDLKIAREKLKTYHKQQISMLGITICKDLEKTLELPRRVRRTFRAVLYKLKLKEKVQNKISVGDAYNIIKSVDQDERWKKKTLDAQACGFAAYVLHVKQTLPNLAFY